MDTLKYLVFFMLALAGCGRTGETEIKVFTINIEATPEEKVVIQKFIKDYNNRIGFQALIESQPGQEYNSTIAVTRGLTHNNPGKVGLGRWTADIETKGLCGVCTPVEKEVNYSMRADFDAEFFNKRMNSKEPADQAELTTLFYHEIGHGLTMDHQTTKNSVMFSEITCLDRNSTSCGKDFTAYLDLAKRFFSKPGNL